MITSQLGQSLVLSLFFSGMAWEQAESTALGIAFGIVGGNGKEMGVVFSQEAERAAAYGAVMARKAVMGAITDKRKDPEHLLGSLLQSSRERVRSLYVRTRELKPSPPLTSPPR